MPGILFANRRSNSAAADCYAAIYRACGNRLAKPDDEIRIVVVGIQAVSAEIHDLVPCRTDPRDEFFLKCKAAMICRNPHTHGTCPLVSEVRRIDVDFCQAGAFFMFLRGRFHGKMD